MMTFFRRQVRRGLVPALALILMAGTAGVTPVLAQPPKEAPAKEVTDGFFDVPARDTSGDGPETGFGSYFITSLICGLAIFILCKSARRS